MAARRPPRGRGAGPRPRTSKASNRGPCSRPSRVRARGAPRCRRRGAAVRPRRDPGPVQARGRRGGAGQGARPVRGRPERADPYQRHAHAKRGVHGADHRGGRALGRGDHPGAERRPGRRIRRAELDLHEPGHLQRPLLHQRLALGHVRRRPPRPAEPSTAARRTRRGRPATPARTTVYVGIIDEGIQYNHPDLAANIWTNPARSPATAMDNDGNGYVDDIHGWDFANNNNSVYDGGATDDHGTHVAGTIGAVGGNGSGVVGRQLERQAISAQVPRPQRRHDGQRHQGGRLLHRPEEPARAEHRRHEQLVGRRRLLAGPARRHRPRRRREHPVRRRRRQRRPDSRRQQRRSRRQLPRQLRHAGAGYDAVISVAAITSSGRLASFSNYGATTVDIGAPGVGIYSTLPGRTALRLLQRHLDGDAARHRRRGPVRLGQPGHGRRGNPGARSSAAPPRPPRSRGRR